jgi:AcrR family transcriptional regulator
MEAGLAEFALRGFEAARMEDVARRAGVAKGTVFLYFPTKEALFEAALRSRLAPVLEGMETALDAYPGPTIDLLRMLVDRVHSDLVATDAAAVMHMILAEGPRFPALLETYHRESIARAAGLLHRIVQRGVARGEFRDGAVADLPMVLMAPALMAALWRQTFDRLAPIAPNRFRAAHIEMLERVLCQSGKAGLGDP